MGLYLTGKWCRNRLYPWGKCDAIIFDVYLYGARYQSGKYFFGLYVRSDIKLCSQHLDICTLVRYNKGLVVVVLYIKVRFSFSLDSPLIARKRSGVRDLRIPV